MTISIKKDVDIPLGNKQGYVLNKGAGRRGSGSEEGMPWLEKMRKSRKILVSDDHYDNT